jgi:TrmH family RNA methyltransferase
VCVAKRPSLNTVIENPRSPRVRAVAKLAKKSRRKEAGMFLVEGPQAVRELLQFWPTRVIDVFVTDKADAKHADILALSAAAGVVPELMTDAVAEQMADTQTPQGVIAVAAIPRMSMAEATGENPQLVVVLDQVRDPGNAGAIIRVADAVGANAVIFAGDCVDAYNPKVVRATTGSLFHLPIVTAETVTEAMSYLASLGLQVFAADMAGESLPGISAEVLAAPTAWIFGNEAHGVSADAIAAADKTVSLPQYGDVESLNLATAAAVCLYQSAFAQRENTS